MLDRSRFLLVHGADPVEWAKRHDIEPFTKLCACGAEITTSIPFAYGKLRGLIAPQCCGDLPPYCIVATTLEELFADAGKGKR